MTRLCYPSRRIAPRLSTPELSRASFPHSSRPGGARDFVPATSDRVRSVAYSDQGRAARCTASSPGANQASSLGHLLLRSRRALGASVRCPRGVSYGRGQGVRALAAPTFFGGGA